MSASQPGADQEWLLESMDTDSPAQASSRHTPLEQVSVTICAEQETEPPVDYTSSIRSGLGIRYYSMYNKNSIDTSSSVSEITNFLESNFSYLGRYEVNEPVGYGLLMGCRGPETEKLERLSSAVYRDVTNMEEALNKSGKWTTLPIKNKLDSGMLRNQLDALKLKEFRNFSVFLLFYSGHGDHKGVILDDNRTFLYSEIVTSVASIDSLKNMPKIFIFDCCRVKQNRPPQVRSNCAPFYQELEQTYCEEQKNLYGYPPPHTLICYSATDNCSSQLHDEQGSFYTIALTHALKQFGKHLSFIEIITQVNGMTRAVTQHCVEKNSPDSLDQRPIFMSNLDKHLVLSVRSNEEDAEIDAIVAHVSVLCSEASGRIRAEELVYKGPHTPCHPHDGGRSLTVSLRDVEVKSEWKSRCEIEHNLHSIGDGISVFFIYAPNPDDPYKKVSSQDPLEQRNRYLMCRLFFDLERHGFHVVSDLHLGDTEPANWVQWYITRILHCNFVIFVCSPAFKELFQEQPCVDKVVNDKARRLLDYRNAIYSGISRELSRAGERRKFLPVILDDYKVSECVPALFECGKVFHVKHEASQRKFNYDDKRRDFEKLVCYMAGINRMKLEQPPIGQVTILGGYFDMCRAELMLKEDNRKRLLEGPPPGYTTAEELRPPSNLVGQLSTVTSHSRVGVGGASIVASMPMNCGGRISHQPASIPSVPQVQRNPSPRPLPHVDPSSLPLKVPDRRIYLWLSSEIMSWKFIARPLGIQESEIERIEIDHRGLDEHRFQMFQTWERRYYHDCNYQKLGAVLLNSENNRRLYDEYVTRVKKIEPSFYP